MVIKRNRQNTIKLDDDVYQYLYYIIINMYLTSLIRPLQYYTYCRITSTRYSGTQRGRLKTLFVGSEV